MARILILVGSPRRGGNTETLADAFMLGALNSGNDIVKIVLKDNPVNPCIACDHCMAHEGECIQKDGMQQILSELYRADVLVLATPLYTFGFSAQMKAVLDRFYVSIAKPFNIHATALLAVYGDKNDAVIKPLISNYKTFAEQGGLKDLGIVTVGEVLEKGDIEGNEGLDRAEAMGKGIS